MKEFQYTKTVNLGQLRTEIENSFITVALAGVFVEDETVHVDFKADLASNEEVMLTTIIDNHDPLPVVEDQPQQVQLSNVTDTDGIPYVYNTSKPLNHYVCFQGADDRDVNDEPHADGTPHLPHFSMPEISDIGRGTKLTFRLTSKTEEVTKDFMFNQNVYIKDGYMICKDAPFGATADIDIIHPVLGILFPFGRNVPLFGTGWFPLDTNDRGYLPKGLKIRITVKNATGSETNLDEETPATFFMFGRFELYRPKPPGT